MTWEQKRQKRWKWRNKRFGLHFVQRASTIYSYIYGISSRPEPSPSSPSNLMQRHTSDSAVVAPTSHQDAAVKDLVRRSHHIERPREESFRKPRRAVVA
jgi:hypothetical protein